MSLDKYETDGKEKKKAKKNVSFYEIYRYATAWDMILLFIAFVFTFIKALTLPCLMIIYGEFCALLVDRTYGVGSSSQTNLLSLFGGGRILVNATVEENRQEIYYDSISYGILMAITALVHFITGVFYVDIMNYTALKQVTRIKNRFFKAILVQDIGWHDTTHDQNFAVRMTDDLEKIRDGISEKLGHFMNLILGFLVTICISFIYGWKLTLAISVYIPIVIVTNIFVTKYQSKLTMRETDAYSVAGGIVEEVLGGIRTVVAFNGEGKESERYDNSLIPARRAGQRKGAFSGFGEGVMRLLLFVSCAGAFWYGVHLILADRGKEEKEYTPAVLMIAFFGVIVGADNIAKTSPFLEAFAMARGSATTIFKVVDSTSKINPLSTDGKILNYGLKGEIEFQDIFFKYPSREDVTVHRGINIKIESGQTVALVGSSGCGKSTCIQLLQRFYDPIFGQILLDGLDIRKYNISWLRSNIAVVGQEPVLFLATIGENIRYGKPDASQKEVEEAAKAAGVHDFIINLPETYNTMIGEKGAQLSGGQKQRIAIARALIQNPKVLLLDEATSALDYQSEKLVQEALDLASKGRTTIVVSHRLSAIKHADKIVFIENGKVMEEGTHDELMKLNGKYCTMVSGGSLDKDDEFEEEEDNTYDKSFEIDVNNLQEYHENHNQRNSLIHNNHAHFLGDSLKKGVEPKPIEEADEDDFSDTNYWKTFCRILKVAKPEWPFLILGVICAALFGCTYSSFAILFGEFYAALALEKEEDALDATSILCIAFLILGIGCGLLCFLQTYLLNLSGVWLTVRIRSQIFKAVLRQDMSWFDNDKNNVGALSARLAGDAANVQGSIGYPLSGIIQSITNFGLGVSLAMYFSWKLALLCLACVPLIVGSVIFEAKMLTKATIKEKIIIEGVTSIATEAITNIRTVAGLRREPQLIAKYNEETNRIEKIMQKKLRLRGLINSTGQSIPFVGYAAALCYGGVLVSEGAIPFQNIIKVSETLLYGSMMLGQCLAFAPAFSSALVAGHRLFKIIDRQPRIKSLKNKSTNNNDQGQVSYNNIEFRYPKRPDIPILQGLNLEIPQGKTVALVGHSGCGKSTCIQLLQRLYDPDNGKIFIGQSDISTDFSLPALRSKLGIVSQEPVLFEKTISENISYGDNSREVSSAEIMEAAKMANIHSFIISLPLGYDTKLGSKGTQLSGGEKQRIAIARALIRNPKILLLDEATSALDLQSEKVVQMALDSACTGRTCIVIAHRLSTVQNADMICVIQNGRVVEQGKHQQLLAKGGIYAHLHRTQPTLN